MQCGWGSRCCASWRRPPCKCLSTLPLSLGPLWSWCWRSWCVAFRSPAVSSLAPLRSPSPSLSRGMSDTLVHKHYFVYQWRLSWPTGLIAPLGLAQAVLPRRHTGNRNGGDEKSVSVRGVHYAEPGTRPHALCGNARAAILHTGILLPPWRPSVGRAPLEGTLGGHWARARDVPLVSPPVVVAPPYLPTSRVAVRPALSATPRTPVPRPTPTPSHRVATHIALRR